MDIEEKRIDSHILNYRSAINSAHKGLYLGLILSSVAYLIANNFITVEIVRIGGVTADIDNPHLVIYISAGLYLYSGMYSLFMIHSARKTIDRLKYEAPKMVDVIIKYPNLFSLKGFYQFPLFLILISIWYSVLHIGGVTESTWTGGPIGMILSFPFFYSIKLGESMR
jgi:hypothetical protein